VIKTLRRDWPEYLMEAAELGILTLAATLIVVCIQYPGSPVHPLVPDPFARRALVGLLIALAGMAVVYSPWGRQSGAHCNPAITLTFYRLGKIEPWDAFFYILAQFTGGILGLLPLALIWPPIASHPAIHYLSVNPGPAGMGVAFVAELAICFLLMMTVLIVSNSERFSRWTGVSASALVALFITFEAPLSGPGINPARSFASTLHVHTWMQLWIYFAAPLLGMLLAAEIYVRWKGKSHVRCAKLHHHDDRRCIFRCGYRDINILRR
jgi:aquaporin Z